MTHCLRIFYNVRNKVNSPLNFAAIYNITPSKGSVAGSTKITVDGDNFDDTDKPLDIRVAGTIDICSTLFQIGFFACSPVNMHACATVVAHF